MRWTNYHGHCEYCDGKGTMEDYILKAIELKMAAIGISSHAPLPFPTKWTMPAYRLNDYFKELQRLKNKFIDRINVYSSLEVDYIPGLVSPADDKFNNGSLDYIIGSVHFVDQFSDGTYWAIDGSLDEFKRGLNDIFNGDIKLAVKRYYTLQREMVEHYTPTIIGHMDKIKMYNNIFNLFDENESWYLDELYKTFELIKEKGVIVEINTKAYYRDDHLFPGAEHFAKMRELGIPVTINSDVHHPDKLLNGFGEIAGLLAQNGYTQVRELIKGEWEDVAFSKDGIEI